MAPNFYLCNGLCCVTLVHRASPDIKPEKVYFFFPFSKKNSIVGFAVKKIEISIENQCICVLAYAWCLSINPLLSRTFKNKKPVEPYLTLPM